MKYEDLKNKLIDLDTLVWYLEGNEKLPKEIIDIIEDNSGINFVCTSSLWELSLRIRQKEIQLSIPFRVFETILTQNQFVLIQPGINEFETLSNLPGDSNKIFERMLITQCMNKNLTLITANKNFENKLLKVKSWQPIND
jgi:PIN domain nuclease of toxin-antitoxin system